MRQRTISIIAIVILLIIIIGYAAFNARLFFAGPNIRVNEPASGTTFTDPFIIITGTAENTAFIKLNERPIYVNENNEFREELLLAPGTSIMKLEATDRFGRKATESLWYTYITDEDPLLHSSGALYIPLATTTQASSSSSTPE